MLAWEKIESLLNAEPHRLQFFVYLFEGHFMFGFDRDRWVFAAIFDQYETTARFERATDLRHRLFGIGKLMVHIHHEGKIKCTMRKFCIGWRTEHGVNVVD